MPASSHPAICSIATCNRLAWHEPWLHDYYWEYQERFSAPDESCGPLCSKHAIENELGARGLRGPRSEIRYPFTKQTSTTGFTAYRLRSGADEVARQVHTYLPKRPRIANAIVESIVREGVDGPLRQFAAILGLPLRGTR
jgi:hypothetical protein